MEDLTAIIECLLFVTEEPLTVERIKEVVSPAEKADIAEALRRLSEEYEARGGGFYLKHIAGGYQLRTRPRYAEWVQELVKPSPVKLSRAALETLAIIAYKQPIIRSDIEHIRGVDSGGVLRMLLEKKLVRVLGRKDIPGRPMIYATTKRFLELFDLRDIRDLPTLKEIEALGATDEPSAQEQRTLPLETESPGAASVPFHPPKSENRKILQDTETEDDGGSGMESGDTGTLIPEDETKSSTQRDPMRPPIPASDHAASSTLDHRREGVPTNSSTEEPLETKDNQRMIKGDKAGPAESSPTLGNYETTGLTDAKLEPSREDNGEKN
jgi:segregation and condensation protein B